MEEQYEMAINQQLWNIEINLQMNTRGTVSIFIKYFFPTGQSTKHSVDQSSADYVGFYRQGSGKSDKYGFSLLPA